MKQLQLFITILTCAFFASCDGRTGYYDEVQQERIALLTNTKWFKYYEKRPNFEPTIYESGGAVYSFSPTGQGTYKVVDSDGELEDGYKIQYFQWTFTTDNFTVMYLGGNLEDFWLIDKLTANELWVHSAMEDPVINPNTDQAICKFKAIDL